MSSIYEAIGGSESVIALTAAWHRRCLADPVVSHAFSHPGQNPKHLERLAAYWSEALGGPKEYSSSLGDQTLVHRLHAGNGEHSEMDERAIACFAGAVEDVGLDADPRVRDALNEWFRWSTKDLAHYPRSAADVPETVPFRYWSWGGISAEA